MTKIKKVFKPLLTLSLVTALFSCNSAEKKEEAPKPAADSTTAATVAPAPAAFTPFDVMEISHTVKDYNKWRPLFNTDSTARRASGMEDMIVGRANDNPNNVIIALKISDIQKAKDFGADPRLKAVMEKAGVISKPDIQFFHVIRLNPDSKEKQWVLITHRVKDFDAWLKIFDAEGTTTRASYGLIDVALTRGIDDPNVVHIVFDIKDMAKAKARMNDPALKKLMSDAGVEGAPKIEFYSTAE